MKWGRFLCLEVGWLIWLGIEMVDLWFGVMDGVVCFGYCVVL